MIEIVFFLKIEFVVFVRIAVFRFPEIRSAVFECRKWEDNAVWREEEGGSAAQGSRTRAAYILRLGITSPLPSALLYCSEGSRVEGPIRERL